MAIRSDLNKIQLLIAVAAILTLSLGCGTDDESIVEPDTSTGEPDLTPTPDPNTVTGSLKGVVEKIEGVSVAIHVLQNGNAVASATADADGNYQIDNIALGTYTVEIVAKGYEAVEKTVQINADGVASLDKVTLKMLEVPVSHIQGTLSDRLKGSPLNGVRVRLVDATGNSREVLTAQTGAFAFENVPADQPFTVSVEREGFENEEFAVDPIQAGKTTILDIALDASLVIRGLVLDQVTKKPIVNVRVQLTDEAGVISETVTTALGAFEFEAVAPKPQLTLILDSDEHEKLVLPVDPVGGGTEQFDLQLTPLNPEQLPEGDGLAIGLKAPDFNLPDSDGEMVALADYAGDKKVVLVFDRGEW